MLFVGDYRNQKIELISVLLILPNLCPSTMLIIGTIQPLPAGKPLPLFDSFGIAEVGEILI
ncbi:MAG: hypothetical protein P8J33_09925 [Pirellulaceae bacterium]|nr:hypothetical protein [Pirellulaceae bacterium]